MPFADQDFNSIKNKLDEAYKKEEEKVKKFREFARRLKNDIRKIKTYSVNAVSFVSADGGDNRLHFNPALIELVRVVDSRGIECAMDAIASNSGINEFRERSKEGSPLMIKPIKKLCDDLGMGLDQISALISDIKDNNDSEISTAAIRAYRDIVEWAVLYDLLHKDWGNDTILVKDGLLRTKSIKLTVFPIFDSLIRKKYEERKGSGATVSLVGVAKQSSVLSKLSMALELEGVFHKNYPCYVKVPRDIEQECYNFQETWLNTFDTAKASKDGKYRYQSMGSLFLVKFGDRPYDPVWPVDIAEWEVELADKILGQLTQDAQPGFPIPDYPMCIQKAHDHAQIGGLEVSILRELLFEGITKNLSEEEQKRMLRLKYLGENLAKLRYKNA